jgi:hypothetical protein
MTESLPKLNEGPGVPVDESSAADSLESQKAGGFIDGDKLTKPPIFGFANVCAITEEGNETFVDFLSECRGRTTRIVAQIVLTAEGIVGFRKHVATFYPQVRKVLAEAQVPERPVVTATQTEDAKYASPERAMPAYLANFFQLYRLAREAQLDCYWLTSRSAHLLRQEGGSFEIIPVATIQLPLDTLVGFLTYVVERAQHFESQGRGPVFEMIK